MSRLIEALKTVPLPQLGVGVLVLLLLMALVSGGVGGCVSKWKDSRFDREQAEREAEIKTLTTEREQAIGRAQAAEARAKELEAQVAISEAALEVASTKVETAKVELEKEDERYKKEVEAVGDDVDTCTRLIRICERAKQLGLYPKNKACDCQ